MKDYKDYINEAAGGTDKIQQYYYSLDHIEDLRDLLRNADDKTVARLEELGLDVKKELAIFTNIAKEKGKSKIGNVL